MSQNAYYVSGSSLVLATESDESLQDDPRGIVWMFEDPKPNAHYIMGMDPTVGITGWHRGIKVESDTKTDNGAIEIYRVDAVPRAAKKDGKTVIDPITKEPRIVWADLQVCEFAAPVDAVEIARIANILGRVYRGDAEDQCELIFESQPGPGILTCQEILRLNYGNLWYWEYIDSQVETTNRIGWRSYANTQRILWYRARRHMMDRRVVIKSPALLLELQNAVIDPDKMRAQAAYGSHDDRIQASSMAWWAGHKWTYDPDSTVEPVTSAPVLDYQRYAPGIEEHVSWRDVRNNFFDD